MDRVGEDVMDTCSLLDDITLANITDDEDANLLLDGELVEVTDGVVIRLLDNELVCTLLDIKLVDMTDDTDTNLLLDSELVNFIEITALSEIVLKEVADDETGIDGNVEICSLAAGIVEFSSLFVSVLVEVTICTGVNSMFDAAVVEVTDTVDNIVVLMDTTPVTDTDVMEVALVLDTTLVVVMLDTVLVDGVEILVNKLVGLLLDIIPVDTSDDTDVNSLVDSELVKLTDGMEITSLLEMVLIVDDVLLETDIDNAEVCSLAVLDVVESSLLFITVLVEITACTEISPLFDSALAEVTDAVDVILLIDTVLVAVINCAVEDCSLLDMIFILVTDDAYVDIKFSDTETSTVTLVGTTDVELSSLLATATAEVTVCAEFSSLLDIALVDVPDNDIVLFDSLLVTDGTDSCSVLIEAMDDVVAD